MNIYWMESIYHDEDWFVAAEDPENAIEFFSDYLDFDAIEDEVEALDICPIDNSILDNPPEFLTNHQIITCGGELVNFDDKDLLKYVSHKTLESLGAETRIVRFGNRVFMEGNIMRVAMYALRARDNLNN